MSKSKSYERGFIVYRGKSMLGGGDVVCIATLHSKNGKTGDMVQVWIIPEDIHPLDALHEDKNFAACGTCIMQGTPGKKGKKRKKGMDNRGCYVNVGQAPAAVFKGYKRGIYPEYRRDLHEHYLSGRYIRLGAYGDPAAMPVSLVKYLATIGRGHTGYSHQLFWIDQQDANELAKYLMVSCHNKAQHAEARRRGWRSFVVIAEGQDAPDNAVQCPYYTHEVQCIHCKLCQGTSKAVKDVYVLAHGKVGKNLPKLLAIHGEKL